MRCPSCHSENRPEHSYCAECGGRLAVSCPSCGAPSAPTDKFCGTCGFGFERHGASHHGSGGLPESFARGRYQVRGFLGEGSRKRVYLAHDTRLDRDVALALVKTEGLDADGLARVEREVHALGRLGDHQHVVTVYDIGEEAGQPYIVSQYMAGGDLSRVLAGAPLGRLDLDQALRIVDEVAQALEHAHGLAIVHRDLKPGNVWLAEDGAVKLGDFGLALAIDRSRITTIGMMVGTAAYMPPEQALGRPPDPRSDLYSLGAMLYEMLTGQPPFPGDDPIAIISQHIHTAPVAPSLRNPAISAALETLVLGLLAKTPEERPASAGQVRTALTAVAAASSGVAEQVGEEVNPIDRLAGGAFVGRENELVDMRRTLEDVFVGRGRVLLLVGEAGIGKTRVAEELATYARLRRAMVLSGRCYEGEGAPSYWPWVQIVRDYIRERDAVTLLAEMGARAAADIAQIVPEVHDRLPGLPEPLPLDPDQARFRLFDGVATCLTNASKAHPLLVVLDDLHWADEPSLRLLVFFAREIRSAPILVLGTFRDSELDREHLLPQALAELAREQLSDRLALGGLTEEDIARFIEVTTGHQPAEALVRTVSRETEGNPFFVSEVVRLLAADGRLEHAGDAPASWTIAVPQSVRDVVSLRLDHVPDVCRQTLKLAAVLGREFSLNVLERVGNVARESLIGALEEAIAARLLRELPQDVGRFSFSHALVRETLYSDLSAARRAEIHRQVAETMEALGGEPDRQLPELAHHFFQGARLGGDVGKAIMYAQRAAEQATKLMAHEEAAAYYEMALRAQELAPPDEALHCNLLIALGSACRAAAQHERAEEAFLRALELARQHGFATELALAVMGYGDVGWARTLALNPMLGQPRAMLVSLLEEALAAIGTDDSPLRVQLLAARGLAGYETAVPGSGETISQEAIAMARRVGDPSALRIALDVRIATLTGPEYDGERRVLADELVELEEAHGLPRWGSAWQWLAFLQAGELDAFDRAVAGGCQFFDQTYVTLLHGMRTLMEGRLEAAEELAQQALVQSRRSRHPAVVVGYWAQVLMLRREQARLAEVEDVIESIGGGIPGVQAILFAELGRVERARRALEETADPDATYRHDDFWLMNVVMLGNASCVLRDAERAALLYDMLLPYGHRNVVIFPGVLCLGWATYFLGMMATTLERWEDAEAHFEEALAMNDRMGARLWLARTQCEYAAMLLARGEQGDAAKALDLLAQSLDTAQELGLRALLERGLSLKLSAQGAVVPYAGGSIEAVTSAVMVAQPDVRSLAAPDGTVTILFTDIEGSTAMNERLGDARWFALLRKHNALLREQIRAHGGYEVKSQGDGFMVAFNSARRALHCAIAIQRAVSTNDWREAMGAGGEPDVASVRMRIGLHTGEAVKDAGDFYGRHVNMAARVAGAAQAGEILISALLRELTDAAGQFLFDEGRDVQLKGLSGAHRLYAVQWDAGEQS